MNTPYKHLEDYKTPIIHLNHESYKKVMQLLFIFCGEKCYFRVPYKKFLMKFSPTKPKQICGNCIAWPKSHVITDSDTKDN